MCNAPDTQQWNRTFVAASYTKTHAHYETRYFEKSTCNFDHAIEQYPQLQGDAAGRSNAKRSTLGHKFHLCAKVVYPKPSSLQLYMCV